MYHKINNPIQTYGPVQHKTGVCPAKFRPTIFKMWGPKEQDGLEGMHFADRCILTKLEKSRLYLLSPIHACPRHDPWAMCKQLSHVRAKSEFLTL